jgi:hypothetical protein
MIENLRLIKNFEVAYRTPEDVPAPYQYNYSIKGIVKPEHIQVEYSIAYTGRDGLTTDEIHYDGYSQNDNFVWKGKLDKVWCEEMSALYARTVTLQEHVLRQQHNLHLYVEEQAGMIFSGIPQQPELWEYMMQEMIQGIYEVSMRELPLIINFKKIYNDTKVIRITLQPYFNTRKVLMTVQESQKGIRRSILQWHCFTNILKALYLPDYLPEEALHEEPEQAGTYIDNGEGIWYEFDEAVFNPAGKKNTLNQLEELFLKL